MIPKIIWFTWISDKPIPNLYQKYIDGWNKIMPDYDIRQITLENCPKNKWVDSCIKQRKFVLAGHYARAQRIYEEGGIYLDIDVEVVKRFDDLLDDNAFLGTEDDLWVNNAIMGGEIGHPFFKELAEQTLLFDINHPEVENETGPRMVTRLIEKKGWIVKNETTKVEDIIIYNNKYFYPYLYTEKYSPDCITEETYAIHHWASTWVKAKNDDWVSVIIPCYKQAKYLDECIQSVLKQTYQNVEIIVVNDGSPDNTNEVALKYPVTLIVKQNSGVSGARNIGIKASKGKWIVCLDADDTIEPEFVEKCVGKGDIICPYLEEFGDREMVWHPIDNPTLDQFIEENRIYCASMFKKEVWDKTGGYDESITSMYEDWDLWIRALIAGYKVTIIHEPLFNYRIHKESMCKAFIDEDIDKEYKRIIYNRYKQYHS